MAVFQSIMTNFTTFLMAIILTVIPYAGFELPVIDNKEEDCLLTMELISDVHIEEKELFRKAFMVAGFRNLERAKVDIDGILVAGDITNYADEPALSEYFRIIKDYSPAPVITIAGNHDIGHVGDRDVTDITREEAMANFIRYNNEYMGTSYEHNYFSTEINGYKFIALGDEVIDGGHWDGMDISAEQMAFLDRELASANGEPVFVCCHWPVDGMNGQEIIYPDGEIELEKNDIKSVMEKYKNVFYISGHIHGGIKSTAAAEYSGLSNVEQVNGVTYISLPTYGIVNSFGYPWSGTGMQMEVYEDHIIFRPRNFITNAWFTNSVYTIDIVK